MREDGEGRPGFQELDELEEQLQDYLANRPPPFFVQRTLSLEHIPQAERVAFLKEVFPTADDPRMFEFPAIAGFAAFTQRDDVACLNRYFYADSRQLLGEASARTSEVLEQAQRGRDADLLYGCSELLAYLFVEQLYWEFISQPLAVLRLDGGLASAAAQLLSVADQTAKERRDWLRMHRLKANRARLGFLMRDDAKSVSALFDMAISLGQLCLDRGVEVDRAFASRRDETLHMAGGVKFSERHMTYPNLCAHIKSPDRIKPQPGGIRLTVENGALIANVSPPLAVGLDDVIRASGKNTVFLDLLSLEDRLQIWMTYKGRQGGHAFSYRELHGLENFDLVLRPTQFEVELTPGDEPMKGREGVKGDRMAFLGKEFMQRGNLESKSVAGRKWVFRFPVLAVGLDENGRRR